MTAFQMGSEFASARRTEAQEAPLKKRSFLKLPVGIDAERLVRDYGLIADRDWGVSYWDVHCSIDVILLRGGTQQTEDDFTTSDVKNAPILDRLPYIRELLAPDGPFGNVHYAFVFRTKPNGVTRAHRDGNVAWERTLRVHVPIITNPGAVLLAEERSKHFDVGSAWTFDNQSMHSVVNGDAERVHLIIDVGPGPKRDALMRDAHHDPGTPDPERWQLTILDESERPYLPFTGEPLTIAEKLDLGLAPISLATRVTLPDRKSVVLARLMRYPIRDGDIVINVDGESESSVSRTSLDYMRHNCRPDQCVTVGVLGVGRRRDLQVLLRSGDYWPLRVLRLARTRVRSVSNAILRWHR